MPTAQRTPETRAIGARIRAERELAGFARKEFAALIPTSPKQVSRLEQGYRVSRARLAKIAKVLGLSYDYLVTGQGPRIAPELGPPGAEEPAGPLEVGLERMLRRIIRDEIRRALDEWPGPGHELLSQAAPRT